ncbi:DUF4232 domain-containing protein [Streptomyces sp. HB2AG]|uniref:DUF4232 domain-containing protein n=1 Tax=Streptomyces sp. HB2AG TaxID=2983400 RepID=UPI0022AA4621|nr:DUF4232 domain-containing protein [Streptomyces sp. HB2AG]MCZ2523125.1 DUF4232 domain-containing protein [Streptomyces sp. HB2AG]
MAVAAVLASTACQPNADNDANVSGSSGRSGAAGAVQPGQVDSGKSDGTGSGSTGGSSGVGSGTGHGSTGGSTGGSGSSGVGSGTGHGSTGGSTGGSGSSGVGSGTGHGSTGGSGGSSTGGSGGSDSGSSAGAAALCASKDLSFSTTIQDKKGEDPRHILITATNVGERECSVHHYPYVYLGDHTDARYPVDVYEDSAMEEPVTLAPGDEAYSAMLAGGIPMDQYETDFFTLFLHGREHGSDSSDGREPISVDLPRTVAFDDGARLTHWTTASGFALDFIMSS